MRTGLSNTYERRNTNQQSKCGSLTRGGTQTNRVSLVLLVEEEQKVSK